MRVQIREDCRVCTECETDVRGEFFVVSLRDLVFTLCRKCAKKMIRLTSREIRKSDD